MKYNLIPACFILSLLFVTGLQCRKEQVVCSGNCGQIEVTGTAINKLTGEAVSGVPLRLSWGSSHVDINAVLHDEYIFESSSDGNGNFSFTTTVDTARFSKEALNIRMTDNDKFMMANKLSDSFILYHFAAAGLQNVKLYVYPQTKLLLHLEKPATVTWKNVSLHYAYDNGQIFTAYYTDFPDQFTSQDVTVPTAAGIPTIITISKGKADGTFDETTDSITCKENAVTEKAIML